MAYEGKLIIHTAFYKQQAYAGYTQSLLTTALVLERLGIKFDFSWTGDFHPERAVNDSLSRFAEDEEATDWINIDSDHSWNPEHLVRMLLRPEHIIAASYKMTNAWNQYVGVPTRIEEDGMLHFAGKEEGGDQVLLEADRVAAGMLRIRKKPVLDFIEAHPEEYFYIRDKETKAYRFFWNDVIDHEFTGMDMVMSDAFRALGYPLWIFPDFDISHWGVAEWKGNLHKYLRDGDPLEKAREAMNAAASA